MNRLILFAIIIFSMLSPSAYAGTIELPKTGQTTCYDTAGNAISCAGTGQDGDLQIGVVWPEPRFTNDNGSTPISGDVVVDQLTGLMWARNGNLMPTRDPGWDNDEVPNDGGVIWQHALDYVEKLNNEGYMGYDDWRLPNVNELASLVNAEVPNGATWLVSQGFTNVQSNSYWSSTTFAFNTDWAWFVSIYYGYVFNDYKFIFYGYHSVWPVRAGQCGPLDNAAICLPRTGQTINYYAGDDGDLQQGVAWPNPRLIDNFNNTVIDKLTGLMWTRNAHLPGCKKTWQQALDYVAAMNSGTYQNFGYTDWRLPNINELRSPCDFSRYNPALPQEHPFSNVQSYYWSSTTVAYETDRAWGVDITNGLLSKDYYKPHNGYYVWPVRGGQCGPLGDVDIDTVCNNVDNCPDAFNPSQLDCDNDTIGDICDQDTVDVDGDVIDQNCDNCPHDYNPGQSDSDNDGVGDVCDFCTDTDEDGYGNPGFPANTCPADNCPQTYNPGQEDTNGDGIGNACQASRPLPDTGQTECYDNTWKIPCPSPGEPFYGQDAQYGLNLQSFTDLDNGIVRDNVTGLEWQQATATGTWQGALDYCENLSLGGHDDWRLPTIKELSTLVDSSITYSYDGSPTINTTYFPDTQRNNYWSSTTGTTNPWLVSFLEGEAHSSAGSTYIYYMRAVRGGQPGLFDDSFNFQDNGDGIVTDLETGLMWQQVTAPGKYNWQQAFDYVAAMNSGSGTYGYTDWRLPNRNELQTLVDYSRASPSINTTYFPDTVASDYWSSTPKTYRTDSAWIVNFSIGYVERTDKLDNYYVRAVRGGLCGSSDDSDRDCIFDDGDNSSIVGDNLCTGGKSDDCDDNCILTANPAQEDADSDSSGDACDNCIQRPNSQVIGTCVKPVGGVLIGTGVSCTPEGTECAIDQTCQMNQEDLNSNGIGDACECYADANHDGKVNTSDLGIMKIEFFRTNCASVPCQADINGDGSVNTSDLGIMKAQFFKTGCPVP